MFIVANCVFALGQDKARYKIWREYCKDNRCIVYVHIAPKNYNEANLQKLAQELAAKYKNREVVNLRVFDDKEITRAYVKGIREPINIFSDSRAYFIHKADCGDMIFYKSENDQVKLIKVSWKDEEICNKPFTIF